MTNPSPADPYVLTPDAVEEPPAGWVQAMTRIGPGMILAASIVGTGELIATTNVGATAGFALLWLVIVSCFIKVFVQVELGRAAVSSGDTTLSAFRSFPAIGAMLPWWWLVMVLTTQFQIGAMIGGVAHATHLASERAFPDVINAADGTYLAKHPEVPWAVPIVLLTIVLLVRGRYRLIQNVTMVFVVTFTILTVACVVMLQFTDNAIHWSDLESGLTFHVPEGTGVLAFAMFGITGVGAVELITYPYWCIEKGYARSVGPHEDSESWVGRARGWLRVMRLDAWVSMVVYTVATLAFYLLGAAILYVPGGKGLEGGVSELLDRLAQMYEPTMGKTGSTVFIVIGVWTVLYSTFFAATAATSRTLADFLKVNDFTDFSPPSRDRRWWVSLFCVLLPLFGLVLYLLVGNPALMVTIGGIAQAVTLPIIGMVAVYVRYQRTDKRLTPGLIWDIFLWLSFVGFIVAAGYLILAKLR